MMMCTFSHFRQKCTLECGSCNVQYTFTLYSVYYSVNVYYSVKVYYSVYLV